MTSAESVDQIIARLALLPHPEGGFFRETYRSRVEVPTARGPRAASTSIYFLLTPGNFSALHRIQSDEGWHFYAGDALEVIELTGKGEPRVTRLGADLGAGEVPQHMVPAGVWFGSRVTAGPAGHALVGCTVAPGFDMIDFELGRRSELLAAFPTARDLVLALTREEP
jgi:hypothetical protein